MGQDTRKCAVCMRPAIGMSEYCQFHAKAFVEIERAFGLWKLAFADETSQQPNWERYLETITKLKETGDWAKQVAVREIERVKKISEH